MVPTPAVVKERPLDPALPTLWSCEDRPERARGEPNGKGEYGDCLGGGEEPSPLMATILHHRFKFVIKARPYCNLLARSHSILPF